MDHGDGNMQRWKRGATREQLRMALDGVVESISHNAKEGIDICVRLSTQENCQGRGSLGIDCFVEIMRELIRIEDLVQELELSEAMVNQ